MGRLLSEGTTGDDVRMLQAVLNYHRQRPTDEILTVDGDFRQKTKKRVQQFQTLNFLDPDGKVGAETRKMLMTICRFSAEYVVLVDPLPPDFPIGNGPFAPTTQEYELASGIKQTLSPWRPPPTRLRYVLEFEAAWVVKNPGFPASFSVVAGGEIGRTLSTPSPDGPYIYSGSGHIQSKFERDFELGPIKLDSSIQAGFEAEHEINSHHVELSSQLSLASGISFAVIHDRFYLFAQGELGVAITWVPGTVQTSAQWEGTTGFKLTF